jgi:ParB-like chromosome segregation protein Spo0J
MNPLKVVEEIDDDAQPTGRFLLADGYHRYQAHQQLGHKTVCCRIREGDELTALLLAARENGGRGWQ